MFSDEFGADLFEDLGDASVELGTDLHHDFYAM